MPEQKWEAPERERDVRGNKQTNFGAEEVNKVKHVIECLNQTFQLQ